MYIYPRSCRADEKYLIIIVQILIKRDVYHSALLERGR
jgi:hypothetical protein